MAEAGQALIDQCRVGLGSLATGRKDGGPGAHRVYPVIVHGGLDVFIGNHSPKVQDRRRAHGVALRAFPHPEVDDEVDVSGGARRADAAAIRPRMVKREVTQVVMSLSSPLLYSPSRQCGEGL